MTSQDELQPRLWETVDTYVNEKVADATADLNAQVGSLTAENAQLSSEKEALELENSTLTQQVAALTEQNNSLTLENSNLQERLNAALAEIERLKGGGTNSPTLIMGARVKNDTWDVLENNLGPVGATRFFHTNIPAQQTRKYKSSSGQDIIVPDDVNLWVSFRDGSTEANLRSYVESAAPGTVMVPHHEPEGDYANGQAFKDWFDRQVEIIHDVDPDIPVVHAAASYHYRPAGDGYDGSYIPDTADIYTIDTYRRELKDMKPLSEDDRFQRWLSLLSEKGIDKPVGITEYGRGEGTDAGEADRRVELMQADYEYLNSINAVTWQYWWADNADGNWAFTDEASQEMWRSLAGGNPLDHEPSSFPGAPVDGSMYFGSSNEGSKIEDWLALSDAAGGLGMARCYYSAGQESRFKQDILDYKSHGVVVLASFKVPNNNWAEVAGGQHDDWLQQISNICTEVDYPVFFCLHHEPNGNGSSSDFRAMYAHSAPILKKSDNLVLTPILNGWLFVSDAGWQQWMIPESDVDGIDIYPRKMTNKDKLVAKYKKGLDNLATGGKPMLLAEYGARELVQGEYSAQMIRDLYDYLLSRGDVVGMSYFNSSKNVNVLPEAGPYLLDGERLAKFRECAMLDTSAHYEG